MQSCVCKCQCRLTFLKSIFNWIPPQNPSVVYSMTCSTFPLEFLRGISNLKMPKAQLLIFFSSLLLLPQSFLSQYILLRPETLSSSLTPHFLPHSTSNPSTNMSVPSSEYITVGWSVVLQPKG